VSERVHRGRSSARLAGYLLAAVVFIGSCYSWIGRYTRTTTGKTPYVDSQGRRFWYLDIAARSIDPDKTDQEQYVREQYVADLFDPNKGGRVDAFVESKGKLQMLRRPGQPPVASPNEATGGVLVFRAGFVSDVHIREPSVKLFSQNTSETLDNVIDSFERNGYQEAFQSAVFAATVSAFNQLDSPDQKPRLVINTGDATDAGTVEEAYDFASVIHHLWYPMLYALGNHDDAIFGNYQLSLNYTKSAGPTFYPTAQRVRFMKFFNSTRVGAGFSDALVPLPSDFPGLSLSARWGALDIIRENEAVAESALPSVNQNTCATPGVCKQVTGCAGFDLYGTTPGPTQWDRCDKYPGYYSVVLPAANGEKVQLIALNSTHGDDTWGENAAFDSTQAKWLFDQLKVPSAVTILFMHHPSASVPGLMGILDPVASLHPLVVLSGHTHSHATEWRGHFWEVNTGSLEEFPQWARLIEIRKDLRNGRYYLNARVLRPHLPLRDVPPDLTAFGMPGAMPLDEWDQVVDAKKKLEPWFEQRFAECDVIAALKPPDYGGRTTLLQDSAQCGYLGALYDHVFVPYATLGKASSQRGVDASAQADVILDISQ